MSGARSASGRRTAEVLLFAATLVWGSSFIVMKGGALAIPPAGFVFYRFLLAAVLCAAIFARRLPRIRPSTLWKGAALGVLLLFGILFQVWGLRTTSASNSAFLTGLAVIAVPILEAFLRRRRPSAGPLAGAVLALAGIALLSGMLSGPTALVVGDGLTLLGTVAWTLQIAALDRFVEGEDAYALTFLQFAVVAVLSGAWHFATGGATLPLSAIPVLPIVYTGIVGTVVAFTVQTAFQYRTTPTRAVLIYSFEPVFALMFALVIPGPDGATESLTLVRAAGCLLVFIGILASEFLPFRMKRDA